jgi:hypothetical protein
VKIYP